MRATRTDRRHAPRWATLLVLACLVGCGAETPAPPVNATDPLAQAQGEWLVINYWAEWCKPCLEEIPELNRFAREQAPRVRVLMVNFDGVRGAALQEQAARLGIEAGLLEDEPSARLGFALPQVLPSTFVIAPDGSLRQTLLGPQTAASLLAAIGGG